MVHKLLRRSGKAVLQIARLLDWQPDAVFQVGIGKHYEEVGLMKEAWPGVKFVGCDPHPLLQKNLASQYPGEFHPTAIGNREGKATLHGRRSHKGAYSLHRRDVPKEGDEEFEVPITVLDTLFPCPKYFGDFIMLWLDCEGSELSVLQGGTGFLESVDMVNVEMTSNSQSRGWCRIIDVHCCLVRNGFVRQTAHSHRTTHGKCDAVYVKKELFKPEFCSCPVSFIDKSRYL